nr:hypothetical protein [Tanacetum cinerariifolium]
MNSRKAKEVIDDLNRKVVRLRSTVDMKNIELLNLQTALSQYYNISQAHDVYSFMVKNIWKGNWFLKEKNLLDYPKVEQHTAKDLIELSDIKRHSVGMDQMVNEINQLHHLSYLIEANLQDATNASTQTPPSSPSPPSPLIHPATLDQVNFHSGFCRCCMYTQNQFHSLRDELNWIQFLLTRPPIRVHVPQNNTSTTSPL